MTTSYTHYKITTLTVQLRKFAIMVKSDLQLNLKVAMIKK